MNVDLDNWCVVHKAFRVRDDPHYPQCCRFNPKDGPCVLINHERFREARGSINPIGTVVIARVI